MFLWGQSGILPFALLHELGHLLHFRYLHERSGEDARRSIQSQDWLDRLGKEMIAGLFADRVLQKMGVSPQLLRLYRASFDRWISAYVLDVGDASCV